MQTPLPTSPPFTHHRWLTNVRRALLAAVAAIILSLTVGVLGYHWIGDLRWFDALLEASMILGGMGPVAPMTNDAVKIFASAYAMFSGLMLVSSTGILFAPWLQRLFYHTHRQARHDAIRDEAA